MGPTNLREYLQRVRRTSGMYLSSNTFAEACAFLVGYDEAVHGALLGGFREWLVVRTNGRSNLAFTSLVLNYVVPRADLRALTPEENRLALHTLFDLIDEYLSLGNLENRIASATQLANARRVDRFHCLCCGFATMRDVPPGTHQICQVCFWHDDQVDAEEFIRPVGPNRVSLKQARENFLKFGASEERVLKFVRNPTDLEQPRLPFEELTAAADLLLRTKSPSRSDIPRIDKIHTHLGYWSTFVHCIVFPLIMGLQAVYSGLDVSQGLADVKDELVAALADPEVPDRVRLAEYLTYCDLVTQVWQSANPRWDGMEWVLEPN